jgi:hypothetical protein
MSGRAVLGHRLSAVALPADLIFIGVADVPGWWVGTMTADAVPSGRMICIVTASSSGWDDGNSTRRK